MSHLNIEIKARCSDLDHARAALKEGGAVFHGLDHQIDTYFRVPKGRLKLREGMIENALIHYHRENSADPKRSIVTLYPAADPPALKEVLSRALESLVVVDKQREIWYADNVKLHVDTVKGFGGFVEIEAIDRDGSIGERRLRKQCNEWIARIAVRADDLITVSYSDMLLDTNP